MLQSICSETLIAAYDRMIKLYAQNALVSKANVTYWIGAKICARFVNKNQAVVIVKNRLY